MRTGSRHLWSTVARVWGKAPSLWSPGVEEAGAAPRRPRRLRRLARAGVLLLVLASFVQHACITSYLVSGNSMLPAFADGDRVVVARMPALVEPHRGDTVIARVNGEVLIKRVVGLPGEIISIGHGQVLSNGSAVDDPVPEEFRTMADMDPVSLNDDEFFLMGDHRSVSIDSREFGPVSRGDILGRVILRVPHE